MEKNKHKKLIYSGTDDSGQEWFKIVEYHKTTLIAPDGRVITFTDLNKEREM